MNFSTSPAFVNINPPWAVRALSLRTGVPATGPPRTLGAHGFRPVSRVFHACYGLPAGRCDCGPTAVLAPPGAQAGIPWVRGSTAVGWILVELRDRPWRRERVPGSAVRAAGGRQWLGRHHRPAPAGPACRLAALHADRAGVLPVAVVDAAGLRGRDLPAHGPDRVYRGQARAGHPGGTPGRQAGGAGLGTGAHAPAARRRAGPHHRP